MSLLNWYRSLEERERALQPGEGRTFPGHAALSGTWLRPLVSLCSKRPRKTDIYFLSARLADNVSVDTIDKHLPSTNKNIYIERGRRRGMERRKEGGTDERKGERIYQVGPSGFGGIISTEPFEL